MGRFQALTPQEAKMIEDQAVRAYDNGVYSLPNGQGRPNGAGIIFMVRSVFPFQLFPDEMIIFADRVKLITKTLPASDMTIEMHIHDVAQVEADCGPIFGQLQVYPKLRTEEPLVITRIFRKDALAAREILEELITRVPIVASSY
ncbi:MAG: hypothetical protein WD231_04730 [Candidatus Woykebacteria bacterium]